MGTLKQRIKTMGTTPATPAVEVVKLTVKRRGFDLDSFERKSLEKEIEYQPLAKENFLQVVMEKLGGDQDKLYSLCDSGLKRMLLLDARKGLEPPAGMNWIPSAAIVLDFANNFRGVSPYSKEKDRKKQSALIFAFIKSTPALVESLRVLATAAENAGQDEDEVDET